MAVNTKKTPNLYMVLWDYGFNLKQDTHTDVSIFTSKKDLESYIHEMMEDGVVWEDYKVLEISSWREMKVSTGVTVE